MAHLLVVDDEKDVIYSFKRLFARDNYQISAVDNGADALQVVEATPPDLILMDVRMPGMDGLETLKRMKRLAPTVPIIIMTAYGTTQTAIEAMKFGAYDFIHKPFNVPNLRAMIETTLEKESRKNTRDSYSPILRREDLEEELVGKSDVMQDVYKRIGQVADSDVTVLITGETGTGKELVARALHRNSKRHRGPFLAVNCSAIPEHLLESELFGYEKGAFTGAASRKMGKFEACDGGTLFLDEIGEMPAAIQSKCLRILQEGTFERLGGRETLTADVRLITATNRDLVKEVDEGRFRPDLYYRLKVVQIELPALAQRRDDIPLLVEYFSQKYMRQAKLSEAPEFDQDAIDQMMKYDWPGNVRQLENYLHNLFVTHSGRMIAGDDLKLPSDTPRRDLFIEEGDEASASSGTSTAFASPKPVGSSSLTQQVPKNIEDQNVFEEFLSDHLEVIFQAVIKRQEVDPDTVPMDSVEKILIRRALQETNGNQLRAAKILGVTRATLRKRIERFGIIIRKQVQ
jgi:two-component system nitrogen regulation response regulator GlnG